MASPNAATQDGATLVARSDPDGGATLPDKIAEGATVHSKEAIDNATTAGGYLDGSKAQEDVLDGKDAVNEAPAVDDGLDDEYAGPVKKRKRYRDSSASNRGSVSPAKLDSKDLEPVIKEESTDTQELPDGATNPPARKAALEASSGMEDSRDGPPKDLNEASLDADEDARNSPSHPTSSPSKSTGGRSNFYVPSRELRDLLDATTAPALLPRGFKAAMLKEEAASKGATSSPRQQAALAARQAKEEAEQAKKASKGNDDSVPIASTELPAEQEVIEPAPSTSSKAKKAASAPLARSRSKRSSNTPVAAESEAIPPENARLGKGKAAGNVKAASTTTKSKSTVSESKGTKSKRSGKAPPATSTHVTSAKSPNTAAVPLGSGSQIGATTISPGGTTRGPLADTLFDHLLDRNGVDPIAERERLIAAAAKAKKEAKDKESTKSKNDQATSNGQSAAAASTSKTEQDKERERELARERHRRRKEAEARARQEEEEVDDRLYCVCRQLYDPERLMIACDLCDNWFHTDCVRIEEADIPLIDQFICPMCERETDQRTTYKTRCARPDCSAPALKLSKYCSDWCGVTVAANRLEIRQAPPQPIPMPGKRTKAGRKQQRNAPRDHQPQPPQPTKLDLESLWMTVEGIGKAEAAIEILAEVAEAAAGVAFRVQDVDQERELAILQNSLDEQITKRQVLEHSLMLANSRLEYLGQAIKRWEGLCDAHAAANPVPAKQQKRNRMGANGALTNGDAPCGFDVRLVWDDVDFESWLATDAGRKALNGSHPTVQSGMEIDSKQGDSLDEVEEEGVVCLITRRKCDRHTGWQKTREADFEVEKSVLTRRLDGLAESERKLRRKIEDIEDLARWRSTRDERAHFNGTNGYHSEDVSVVKMEVDQYTEPALAVEVVDLQPSTDAGSIVEEIVSGAEEAT